MRPKTYCFLLHLSFHLHDEVKTENPRPHNQNCIFHWLSLQSYDFDAGKTQKTHHICRHSPHRKLSTIHRMMRNVYPVDSECLPTDLQYFLISVGPSPPTPGWDLYTIVNPPEKKNSSEMSLTLHYGKLTFCSSCGHEIALWPLFDRAETDITSPAKMHLNFSADLCWDETSRKPGLLIRLSRGGFQNGGEKHVNTVQEHAQTQKPRQC